MEIVQDADNSSGCRNETKDEVYPDASASENIMNAAPTPTYIPSSPPPNPADMSLVMETDSPDGAKSDSEAETVLLPGVDGYSPSKSRKVKLEDKNDDNSFLDSIAENNGVDTTTEAVRHVGDGVPSSLGKRKRTKHTINGNGTRDPQRNSSGLSSVPTSPVGTTRSSLSKHAESDSEVSKSSSPRPEKKVKSTGKHSPTIRHDSLTPRDDKGERFRRRQQGNDGLGSSKHSCVSQPMSNIDYHAQDRTRSASPASHGNRRSVSTQPPSALTTTLIKKRKVPAPLRSTKERHAHDKDSEESSAGESPHPRRSHVRYLGTPPTGDSSASLAAKMGKRKRVQYGLSPLAVACEHGELKYVNARLTPL